MDFKFSPVVDFFTRIIDKYFEMCASSMYENK